MRNGNITLSLILGIVTLASLFGAYVSYDKYTDEKEELRKTNDMLKQEKEKNKIGVVKSLPAKAMVFTFLEVNSQFHYLYKRDLKSHYVGLLKDHVKYLYEGEYTFQFGYDLSNSEWNWCPVVNEIEGTVQVNMPIIVQTNPNPVGKYEIVDEIDKADSEENRLLAQKEVQENIIAKLDLMAQTYLENNITKSSIKNSLSEFLRDIMNAGYSNKNPIKKVILNTTAECK